MQVPVLAQVIICVFLFVPWTHLTDASHLWLQKAAFRKKNLFLIRPSQHLFLIAKSCCFCFHLKGLGKSQDGLPWNDDFLVFFARYSSSLGEFSFLRLVFSSSCIFCLAQRALNNRDVFPLNAVLIIGFPDK